MLDFETLDSKPNSVVVSLGMVVFTNEKIIYKKIYHFKLDEQFKRGRSISEGTLLWWMNQTTASKQVFNPDDDMIIKISLDDFCKDFLLTFEKIFAKVGETWDSINLWGNGVIFDIAILENIFLSYGYPIKWNFWNLMDFRTLDRLSDIKTFTRREGTHHNALDDSIYQASCVIEYFKKVKKGELKPKEIKK